MFGDCESDLLSESKQGYKIWKKPQGKKNVNMDNEIENQRKKKIWKDIKTLLRSQKKVCIMKFCNIVLFTELNLIQ